MADVTESNLQIVYQEIGGNNNTWGDVLNQNWTRMVQAVTDQQGIVVTGGTTVLDDDEQRSAILVFTGTLLSDQTVQVNDAVEKWWFAVNNTSGSFTLTIETDSGSGVVIPQGDTSTIYSDGTDVIDATFDPVPNIDDQATFAAMDITDTGIVFNPDANGTAYSVTLNTVVDEQATLGIRAGGLFRWAWGKDGVDETGSNAGADFFINASDDSGSFLYTVLSIERATGIVTIPLDLDLDSSNLAGVGDLELVIDSTIHTQGNTGFLNVISGLNSIGGAGLLMYAGAHPTLAGDFLLRTGDESAVTNIIHYNANGGANGDGVLDFSDQSPVTKFNQIRTLGTDATTNRDLVLSDSGQSVEMTNAAANTVTIPADATVDFDIGAEIKVVQGGAGETSIDDTNVTLESLDDQTVLSGQYAEATLRKIAADTWRLTGMLSKYTEWDMGAFAQSTNYEQAHGLGRIPEIVLAFIECTTAEFGYAIGDRIPAALWIVDPDSRGMTTYANATNIGVETSTNPLRFQRRDNTANTTITAANWKVILAMYTR